MRVESLTLPASCRVSLKPERHGLMQKKTGVNVCLKPHPYLLSTQVMSGRVEPHFQIFSMTNASAAVRQVSFQRESKNNACSEPCHWKPYLHNKAEVSHKPSAEGCLFVREIGSGRCFQSLSFEQKQLKELPKKTTVLPSLNLRWVWRLNSPTFRAFRASTRSAFPENVIVQRPL